MRNMLFRRGLAVVLVAFAGFRLYELVSVLFEDPSGTALSRRSGAPIGLAVAIKGALPIHLLSVALLLQRPYVSRRWNRVAWFATVGTGSWLGIAVLIRLAVLGW